MGCRMEVTFPLVMDGQENFSMTFSLRRGTRIAFDRGLYYLSGDNGSGKTSFLNLLSLTAGRIGSSARDGRGTVILDGEAYNENKFNYLKAADIREKRFAIFPQKAFFLPVSARDNYLVLNGADMERADMFSDHQNPDLLSGGQQQKLLMDIVLNEKKPIWFLDEPLANLDADRRLYFWNNLRNAFENGVHTAFFIDHWLGGEIKNDPDFRRVNTLRVYTRQGLSEGQTEFKSIEIFENTAPEPFITRQMQSVEKEKAFTKRASPLVLSGSWGVADGDRN